MLLSLLAVSALGGSGQVRRVGALLDESGNRAGITGQDMAYSISLGSTTLWLFGDTFYPNGAVSNNAAWTEDVDASDGITGLRALSKDGRPLPVLAFDAAEDPATTRLWPGHGIELGGQVFVYYSRVEVTGKGSWDFKHAGQGLAVGRGQGPLTRLKRQGRADFWSASQPRFGVAVVKGKDARVYVFGRDEAGSHALRLARVSPEKIEDLDAYEYLASTSAPAWSTTLSSAAALFKDGPPEASVSYNLHLGAYMMLYSRLHDQDVVLRTAPQPWGPWSKPRLLYRCRRFCIAAKEHPEYAEDNGRRVYFTLVDPKKAFGGLTELYEADLSK